MNWEDSFADAMGDDMTIEAVDNADGQHVIVSILRPGMPAGGLSIALTADQANALAETLLALAAGI